MISFNNININSKNNVENKNNTKKSSSMNKIENVYSNLGISQKIPTIGLISLSQGKNEKKNLKFNKEIPKAANNTFYNVNLNVIHNNNNNYYPKNNNNTLLSLLNKGYSTNGFKSFYMNKDNKYNYKINTKYIKEENKKYLYNNSFNDKNIIDEKEEFDANNSNIYDYKKKSYSKEKHNKKLLIPYGSEKYEMYNTKVVKNNNGYGTFYNYNKNNLIFGTKKKTGKNKYNNNNKLPKLYKSISNVTQYNNFGYNKNKTKTNSFYFKGKNGFNPYNYDYNSKFRFYMP